MHVAEDLYDQEHCLKVYRKKGWYRDCPKPGAGVPENNPCARTASGRAGAGDDQAVTLLDGPEYGKQPEKQGRVFQWKVGLGNRIMLGTDGCTAICCKA
jgi:hypothetical protein